MFGTIGKYLIIMFAIVAVIGGAILYIKWTSDTIATLSQQVTALNIQSKSLQAANDAMSKDIAAVKQVQDATNQQLTDIRVQSAQTAHQLEQKIHSEISKANTPATLQTQVNSDTAAAFKSLEDLTK